ncbi:MAG: glycosyltransferase [Propionibacteriaceae bacterium]
MSTPRITVVIPVHDDAGPLRTCLQLLAAQQRLPDEVVVVDNACTDDTVAVAQALGARVVTEPRLGIPAAAARGYDAARFELVARLDADSAPAPNWLAEVVRTMTDPQVDAVTGPGSFYGLPPFLRAVVAGTYFGAYRGLSHLAMGHPPPWGSNMALRRSSWERVRDRVHRFDEVHDDMDLAFVLGPEAVIRFDPRLRVDASPRALRVGPQLALRWRRAITTLRINWAERPPWTRWRNRVVTRPGRNRPSP